MSENTIEFPKNDRREIFGWVMYDWANSAYYTTVIGVLIGPYLTALAQSVVGENGVIIDLGFLGAITAKSMTSTAISIGVSLQAIVMLTLGAIADYTHLKKFFMALLCYIGVFSGCLLFFVTGDNYLFGCLLLVISNICIGSSLVFYNAYLGDITTEDQRDKISARGFAIGYLGGGLMLLLNLLLLQNAESLGLSQSLAVRLCLVSAALWWGGFSLITFRLLKSRKSSQQVPAGRSVFTVAMMELGTTFRQFLKLRYTLLFLIGYLFYNDGIQTVIYQSSVFVEQELFVAKGLQPDRSFLLLVFLETQLVAMVGSFFWERVARFIGAKWTILFSLAWWCGIVIFAYGFLREAWQAWFLGAAIGFVLGGTQALSRSLYSQMIPIGREASFFSFYEISEKGTSWMGPLIFGIVAASTNSYRQAILALIVFFIIGSVILFFTDTTRAIHEAGQHTPEEAAEIERSHSA
jgi:UMF1 family MFS transporter